MVDLVVDPEPYGSLRGGERQLGDAADHLVRFWVSHHRYIEVRWDEEAGALRVRGTGPLSIELEVSNDFKVRLR